MAQHFHPCDATSHELPTNYTIILGALSAGSIPQISIHLLLCSLPGFKYFGSYFDPSSQQPTITTFDPTTLLSHQAAQSTPSTSKQVHYGVEFYVNHTYQLVVVSQHAHALPHRNKAFSTTLFTFLSTLKPKQMINLASLPSSHRPAENKDQIQWFIVNPDQQPQQPQQPQQTQQTCLTTPTTSLVSSQTMSDTVTSKTTMNDIDFPESTPSLIQDVTSSSLHLPLTTQSTATHMNILHTILKLPPTSLTDDEIEAQKQYLRIKYSKPMLSVEGFLLALPTSSGTETPATPTKQIKDLDFMDQFPYPIKGGGHSRALAKFVRKSNLLHLTTLVTFPGPQSSQNLTQMLLEYLTRVTGTFNEEFKIPQIVDYALDLY